MSVSTVRFKNLALIVSLALIVVFDVARYQLRDTKRQKLSLNQHWSVRNAHIRVHDCA